MSTEISLVPSKQLEIARKTNEIVKLATNTNAVGFELAFIQANALAALDEILTDEFYEPLMKLKGSPIGFLTDEKKKTGIELYRPDIVKECIKAAILRGLQISGNEFNILAGKPYTTKEGFIGLLKRAGIRNQITPFVPKRNGENAITDVLIEWNWNGEKYLNNKTISVNSKATGASDDAIIGKAERKANKWLYEEVTKNYMPDGDLSSMEGTVTEDINHEDVQDEAPLQVVTPVANDGEPQDEAYKKRKNDAILFLKKSKNPEELEVNKAKAIKILSGFEGFKHEYLDQAIEEIKNSFTQNHNDEQTHGS